MIYDDIMGYNDFIMGYNGYINQCFGAGFNIFSNPKKMTDEMLIPIFLQCSTPLFP